MVEIFDQNQQDFIKQKAQQIGEDFWNFWIGLKRVGSSTIWKWIDSNQVLRNKSYNAWAPGEPNNRRHDGNGDQSAVLSKFYHYQWVDSTILNHQFYSICQLTNKSIIDDLHVPIAPHHINYTGM